MELLQGVVACFHGDLPCTDQHTILDDGRVDTLGSPDVVEARQPVEHRDNPEVDTLVVAVPEGSHVVEGSAVVDTQS